MRWTEQAWGGMAGTAPWTSWGLMMWPIAGAQAEVPKEFPISEAASALRHPLPWDVLSPGQGWEMGWGSGLGTPASDPFTTSYWAFPSLP